MELTDKNICVFVDPQKRRRMIINTVHRRNREPDGCHAIHCRAYGVKA